jgi:hypothetical protein
MIWQPILVITITMSEDMHAMKIGKTNMIALLRANIHHARFMGPF